jgi:peptidoglycan/LPS O-acetylase OafA/YrhL
MVVHRSRLPSLDGLRALSISMVLVSHLVGTLSIVRPHSALSNWIERLGPLGVRVFFVISGFLITSLLLHELGRDGRIDLRRFYFRRTLRIFPPYYALLLVVALLALGGAIELTLRDWLYAITYTINYYPERSWYVGHGWSLAVEEQFYLLWPVALVLLGKVRGLWLAAALLVICPVLRLAYWYLLPDYIPWEVGYRFETVADSIAAGCLLAGFQGWLQRQRFFAWFLRTPIVGLLPPLILCAALMNPRLRLALLVGVSVQNLGIAACIAWAVGNHTGRIGRLLNARPLVFAGTLSYSLYLWQQLFLNPYSTSPITSFPLNLILTVLAALASFYLIERPALRLRQRLEQRFVLLRTRAGRGLHKATGEHGT